MIPSYERPAAPVPATYPAETAPAAAAASPPAAEIDWQRFFADPRLKRLIDLALVNNRDLRVAVLNIEQARALYDVRRADEWPTLGVGGSAARAATRQRHVGTVYTVGAAVTGYELDLFGRVRALSEAALSQYLATAEARKAVQISLVAASRTAYLTLLADDEQLARHAADAGDARGVDPPHQAALRQRRRVRARLPAVGVAARRRAGRARADAAPARARRERAGAAGRPGACPPTCRRRCRSTSSR